MCRVQLIIKTSVLYVGTLVFVSCLFKLYCKLNKSLKTWAVYKRWNQPVGFGNLKQVTKATVPRVAHFKSRPSLQTPSYEMANYAASKSISFWNFWQYLVIICSDFRSLDELDSQDDRWEYYWYFLFLSICAVFHTNDDSWVPTHTHCMKLIDYVLLSLTQLSVYQSASAGILSGSLSHRQHFR